MRRRTRGRETLLNLSFLTKGKRVKRIRFSEPGAWRSQPSKHAEQAVLAGSRHSRKWAIASVCVKIDLEKRVFRLYEGKPCVHCAQCIKRSGIRRVRYSTKTGMETESIQEVLKTAKLSSGYRRH